ncbi:MAG: hypothetical protein KC503_37330, partial [Myxococcales bacterium]|nr:hypothetical protein [Myxococcales bacterium]
MLLAAPAAFAQDLPPDQPLPPDGATSDPAATVGQFYGVLNPYGSWIQHASYGWVWRPNVANFVPYATNGSWTATDQGWMFNSNYNWGWACFHYGRWFQDGGQWTWVPGTVWAPAWVDWRWGGQYVGWAPLAPRGWRRQNRWFFVGSNYLGTPNFWRYRVPHSRWGYAYRITRRGNRRVYYHGARRWYRGPPRRFVGYRRPVVRVRPPRPRVLARVGVRGGHARFHRRGNLRPRAPYRTNPRTRRPAPGTHRDPRAGYRRPSYPAYRAGSGYRGNTTRNAPRYRGGAGYRGGTTRNPSQPGYRGGGGYRGGYNRRPSNPTYRAAPGGGR